MVEIAFTDQAFNDLDDIPNYMGKDSARYAAEFTKSRVSQIKIPEKMPRTERMASEMENESIRELVNHNYRIVYLLETLNQIQVVPIFHGSYPLTLL